MRENELWRGSVNRLSAKCFWQQSYRYKNPYKGAFIKLQGSIICKYLILHSGVLSIAIEVQSIVSVFQIKCLYKFGWLRSALKRNVCNLTHYSQVNLKILPLIKMNNLQGYRNEESDTTINAIILIMMTMLHRYWTNEMRKELPDHSNTSAPPQKWTIYKNWTFINLVPWDQLFRSWA